MIFGAEIALFVMGLVALITGKFPAGKGRTVPETPARCLGLACMLQFPMAFMLGFVVFGSIGLQGIQVAKEQALLIGVTIDIVTLIFFVALTSILARKMAVPDAFPTKGTREDELGRPLSTVAPGTKPAMEGTPDWWHEADAPTSPKARAGLIFGIASLVFSVFAAIPALILSSLAFREIRRSEGRLRGQIPATLGMVLAVLGTFTGAVVFSLVIPLLRTAADPGPGGGGGAPPVALAPALPQPQPQPVAAPAAPAPAPVAAAPKPAVNVGRPPVNRPAAPARAVAKAKTKGRFTPAKEGVPPLSIATKPVASGAGIGGKPRAVGDLKVTDVSVAARDVPRCLIWDESGKAFFVLEGKAGTLRRVALDGFREELRWEIGRPCSWLSTSAEGLLLTVGEREIWVLDPKTFAVRRQIATPTAQHAASSPALSVAFVTARSGDAVGVVDLKTGKVVHEYDSRSFPGKNAGYDKLVVSPDGKFIFSQGMEELMRFAVNGDALEFEEASARIAQNGQAIEISSDGSLVALPSGGGNYEAGAYTTNVYKATDLSAPEVKIESGAYPQALGLDTKAGLIYAQNAESSLIVFGMGGVKGKSYKLAGPRGRDDSPRQFAVHPDGGKLLALSGSSLRFVELPAKGGAAE